MLSDLAETSYLEFPHTYQLPGTCAVRISKAIVCLFIGALGRVDYQVTSPKFRKLNITT